MSTRIGQAVILLHGGDREEARNRFAALWEEIGDAGPPLHRCTLAHYMADTQDDPEDELAWDLRALRAADSLVPPYSSPDTAGGDPAVRSLRGLYPSLHLNLAADYHRLGEHQLARGHLGRAREAARALADDAYGDGVRAAIARLGQRLPIPPADRPGGGAAQSP
jgi:hypothetical protein